MAGNTQNLGLYFKEPIKDGNDTFNIQTMLNDNWTKLDSILRVLSQNKPLADYITERLQNYVKSDEKGAANGVATLGEDSKVPSSQLPEMDYIKSSEKGAANGVATLDANSKIPETQIRFRFKVVSYTGTGTYGSSSSSRTKIQFDWFIPRVIFIYGNSDIAIIINDSISGANVYGMVFRASTISTSYAQNEFSIIQINASVTTAFYPKVTLNMYTQVSDSNQADCQMNKKDVEYTAIAIGEEFISES